MTEPLPDGGWTRPGPMNGTDTLFWRLGGDPLTRPHVSWVWYLEAAPDREVFLRGCERAVRRLPRLTHRVADTALGVGPPSWIPDPDFRLTRHVRQVRLAAPGGERELLDMVEWRNSAAFDPAHPPWDLTLVDGCADDRAAVILTWHHSVGDAVTIVAAARRLLTEEPGPRPPGRGAAPQAAPPAPPTVRSAVADLAGEARDALRTGVRGLSAAGGTGAGARLTAYALSRTLSPWSPSPLLAGRSAALRFGSLTVPLPELKAAGKAAGVSVTSAYVAAVLGAFSRYHGHHGVVRDALPVLVPVSLRRPDETGSGNLVAGVLVSGPIGDMPARARMAAVHESVAEARGAVVREAYTLMAGVGALLPRPLWRRLAPAVLRGIDVVVTSVPGLPDTAAAGARITHAVPWAPRGGAAANISMASHGDLCGVGTNLDPAAVTDPDLFHRFLADSFDETLRQR
ncbi:wax ester/triacylglycerol synthase domain-containing protein [Streptomyces fumanus]|uniref:wax ester/triacylglycerol synthase domain-containing protein n=1 Tax=Streptomyces fumanus TaxID=67302 RepID=UPI0033D89F12